MSGYASWNASRVDRLPAVARTFKQLRNVSLKEAPIENSTVVIDWRLGEGTDQPGLGPHETFTSPWIDSRTGTIRGKATITSADGTTTREVDALAVHDFGVEVESDGKVYAIPAVVTAATEYLGALQHEVDEAERLFRT